MLFLLRPNILVGIGFLVAAFLQLFFFFRARATRQWPYAVGRVLEAYVEKNEDPEGSRFIPRVSYSYSVDGRLYVSNCLTYKSLSCTTEAETREHLKGIVFGKNVLVSYNPSSPSQSVIMSGHNYWQFIGITICLLFAVLFLLS
jgi:hypothetical protein